MILAIALPASPAYALYENIVPPGYIMQYGHAYASANAHSYVNHIISHADHSSCPAVASGYGGNVSNPFSGGHNTAYQSYLCGPGRHEWSPNPVSGYLHGATYNNTQTWYDNYEYTFYSW